MSEPLFATTILSHIEDLERRLRALESTAQVPQVSTIAGGSQSAEVVALENTASGSYTDLTTPGPAVNVVVGGSGVLIVLYGHEAQSPANTQGFMAFELNGANTRAAVDSDAVYLLPVTVGGFVVAGYPARAKRLTGLQPGVTTVTAKYRLGLGAAAYFGHRWILVLPL
jgi:hypothetical protein